MQLTSTKYHLFQSFLTHRNIEFRNHTSLYHDGIQVKMGKDWMAVVWNKNNRAYTVDKRLSRIYSEFIGEIV